MPYPALPPPPLFTTPPLGDIVVAVEPIASEPTGTSNSTGSNFSPTSEVKVYPYVTSTGTSASFLTTPVPPEVLAPEFSHSAKANVPRMKQEEGTPIVQVSTAQLKPAQLKSEGEPESPHPLSSATLLGQPIGVELPTLLGQAPSTSDSPSSPAPSLPATSTPLPTEPGVLELKADRQSYNAEQRTFTAEGNVLMRFRGSVLDADRLQVNLVNRRAVAEGNVVLTRGQQILQGERFEYNFVDGTGTIFNASGLINSAASEDFATTPPPEVGSGLSEPLSGRLLASQPPQQVSGAGDLTLITGAGRDAPETQVRGSVRKVRFEADRVNFTPEGWQAVNVRFTNDPFSPPELEVRADTATLTRVSPEEDVVETSQPRIVFDQGFSVPIPRSRAVLGRRQQDSGLVQLGFDGGDRGGLYIERSFDIIDNRQVQFSVTPQFLVQKAFGGPSTGVFDPAVYGLVSRLDATLGPKTSLRGSANLTSFDLSRIDQNLRASLRLQQMIGIHTLSVETSYRDRLFNGSLGFQDVQTSVGAIITSPIIPLGKTGIDLNYQAGGQYITANTDRPSFLSPSRQNNLISLGRLQGSAALNRGFYLWQGEALPATPDAGLKYTANPVVPYVQLVTRLEGVTSSYTSGDTQATLTGTVGLQAQFGNFSRPFFDYTGFNISYSQTAITGLSPFLFDRAADTRVLSGGFVQQLYGPLRVGLQTSVNLDTSQQISTDYILEYSRRSYGLTLRYNPVLQLGALGVRISDFNWTGGSEPFSGANVQSVERGVRRSNE